MNNLKDIKKDIPENPGVYLMKGNNGKILYIGKAGNIKRRIKSYFIRANETRIEALLKKTRNIDFKVTDSALEALVLEAEMIKKHKPPFNVREKDDTSFLYVVVTEESIPRVILMRERNIKEINTKRAFGPFTSASQIREGVRILRKIFPWNVHTEKELKNFKKPCFDYGIGLCPGACAGNLDKKSYLKTIKKLVLFFEGKKIKVIREFEKEMKSAVEKLEFEKAEKLKHGIFSLKHIRDVATISRSDFVVMKESKMRYHRIEGYDISNISGSMAVGSMVVFEGIYPKKSAYRKFKIRSITGSNDTGMIKEVVERRFRHDWPHPDLILIDGGKGQVSAAEEVLSKSGLVIPVLGIAKGKNRKKNETIGEMPRWVDGDILVKIRDEAHRFAISYHRKLRERL